MIYNKNSNFPYPILATFTDDYPNSQFVFDVKINDLENSYSLSFSYLLDSEFILKLIKSSKASIYVAIMSKDYKYYLYQDEPIIIPKNRITFSDRTTFQMLIFATDTVHFSKNEDLETYYKSVKSRIKIDSANIIALSNVIKFDGKIRKPFDLFEKRVDPNIKSDIKIELTNEMIVIVYKDVELQYKGYTRARPLNNHYLYIGLQRALTEFIIITSPEDYEIVIDDIPEPENRLFYKLYRLMKNKGVVSLSKDNIDEVIEIISDKIIMKHLKAVKETIKYDSEIA